MYTVSSGNGVKVAKKVAKYMRKHHLTSSYSLKKLKVNSFRAETGLKLKKGEIEQLILSEIDRQQAIRKARADARPAPGTWREGRILEMQRIRSIKRENWLSIKTHSLDTLSAIYSRRPRAISLCEALNKSYAADWSNLYTYINFGDDLLRVAWDTDSDWNYYSRRYNRPKNTYSNRRVELLTFSYDGDSNGIKIVDVYHVNAFRGPFLIDAIAHLFNLRPVKVAKGLKKVQLNDYFEITLLRNVCGVQIYSRSVAGQLVDYCALYHNTTYHASTVAAAVAGLKNKIRERAEYEGEIINYEAARKLGFCDAGIRSFATDNELDINAQYTRAELRNIVLRRRELNYDKYRDELRRIGINITK